MPAISLLVCQSLATLFLPLPRPGDRMDELSATWEKAQREVHSLAVDFTVTTYDRVFQTRDKETGAFRFLRTDTGEVYASYDLIRLPLKNEAAKRSRWLYKNNAVYMINFEPRTVWRFPVMESDLPRLAAEYLNPFAALLDRKHALEQCRLKIVKQDSWYTYLDLRPYAPMPPKRLSAVPFDVCRAAFTNEESETIPKDMPRRIWFSQMNTDTMMEITSWRLNTGIAPKPEEFALPSPWWGWEIGPFPFLAKRSK